jgi:hypothetical protein
MLHRHAWVAAEGTIVEVRVQPGHKDPFMAPKVYVVDVRPSAGDPFRAEVQFSSHDIVGFYQPDAGDVTGFRVDQKSNKVEFDRSDPRNDIDQRLAAADQRMRDTMAGLSSGSPLGVGLGAGPMAAAANSPKWVVPAECPTCGAKVEQALAEYQDNPHCEFCHEPLPVQTYQAQDGLLSALGALGVGTVTRSAVGTAAHILEVGVPVEATLLAVSALPGMKNAAGLDVTALVLSVTPSQGGAAYQTRTGQHVPVEAEHLLVPGTVLPGKSMPDVAEAPVVIDWDAAITANPGPAAG